MLDLISNIFLTLPLFFLIELGVVLFLLFLAEGVKEGVIGFVAVVGFWAISSIRHETGYFPQPTNLQIAMYVLIGLIYAIIRLYFAGTKNKVYLYSNDSIKDKETQNKEAILNYAKENFFRWWTLWPISFIYWFFTEFLVKAKEVFFKFAGNLLVKIYKAGAN